MTRFQRARFWTWASPCDVAKKPAPLVLFFLWVILASPSLLLAQPPIGPEFQVNTYTTAYQGGTGSSISRPSRQKDVAFGKDQGFVVVWQDMGSTDTGNINGQDGALGGIVGQRFTGAGARVGDEFQVNTVTAGDQGNPAIDMNSAGEFVVVWSSYLRVGYNYTWGIHGQRFDTQGYPNGAEFNVATVASNLGGSARLALPDIAMADNSPFVVAWQASDGDAYSPETDAMARRYDTNGVPQGTSFLVSADSLDNQDTPRVAMDSDGDFIVAWRDRPASDNGAGIPPSSYPGIFGQRFAADGSRAGAELQINSYTPGGHLAPSVGAHSDGSFVVSWTDKSYSAPYPYYGQVGRDGIQAQRFDSAGNPSGADFRVNSIDADYDSRLGSSDIAVEPVGQFIVTWSSRDTPGDDTSYSSIQARSFGADGQPWGPDIQVNTYTTGSQNRPVVAGMASDSFVIVWDDAYMNYYGGVDGRDGSLGGTLGQLFRTAHLFSNGFETGDVTAWSSVVP